MKKNVYNHRLTDGEPPIAIWVAFSCGGWFTFYGKYRCPEKFVGDLYTHHRYFSRVWNKTYLRVKEWLGYIYENLSFIKIVFLKNSVRPYSKNQGLLQVKNSKEFVKSEIGLAVNKNFGFIQRRKLYEWSYNAKSFL